MGTALDIIGELLQVERTIAGLEELLALERAAEERLADSLEDAARRGWPPGGWCE